MVLAQAEASGTLDLLIGGYHPMTWACRMKSHRLLRRLALIPGTANYHNLDGTTALTWAPNSEFTKALALLGYRVDEELPEDGSTSLHFAARKGRVDQLEALVQGCVGCEAMERFDSLYRTPLACAAQAGHWGAVSYLIHVGANVNACNVDSVGYTVLQFALDAGYGSIAKLLIESGADPHLQIGLTKAPKLIAKEQGIFDMLGEKFEDSKC